LNSKLRKEKQNITSEICELISENTQQSQKEFFSEKIGISKSEYQEAMLDV
jgi:DNA-directed RNA polymerase specialized sigma subunit